MTSLSTSGLDDTSKNYSLKIFKVNTPYRLCYYTSIAFTRNHLVRIYYTSSPKSKSQLICYPNRKIMDIMINNVVLLFSATNEEIPYEHLLQY